MPKPAKGQKFYAVQRGRQTGVFLTWADCEQQTKGYPGAKYQSFKNAAEAEAFVTGAPPPTQPTIPSASSRQTEPSVPVSSASSRRRTLSNAKNNKGKKRILEEALDESQYDVVYCDGACKGNGKPGSIAGVGVWWGNNDPRNIAERCPGDQTNNRAELIAIARVLESTPRSKKPLLIKTDSQYSMRCKAVVTVTLSKQLICITLGFSEWMPKWLMNNFTSSTGGPVKNEGIIKYIAALMKVRGLMGQKVRLTYVKGHSGIEGNEGADAEANKGTRLPPVPERDWKAAKDLVLQQAEEEHRASPNKPTPVPVTVVAGDLPQTDTPRKLRKVSNDVPFSRLSSTTSTRVSSSTRAFSTNPQISTPPPSGPIPVIEVSSSPPRDTVTPPKSASRTADSHRSPQKPEIPIREHGVGLFTATPPPNATLPKKFSPLPPSRVTTAPAKPLSMSVDAADVNLSDYLDCVVDDDFDDV
ncbi:hypothetical protein H0H92_008744 [Tricholoma furcatifolium]|nr:hypothetical protein H0H92_008744 [Tricholoma furcatifolium]